MFTSACALAFHLGEGLESNAMDGSLIVDQYASISQRLFYQTGDRDVIRNR